MRQPAPPASPSPTAAGRRALLTLSVAVTLVDGFDLQSISLVAPILAGLWGVPISHLAIVFAAAPVGMALGALAFGALGDRMGRKTPIMLATALIGLFSLTTAWATSPAEAAACRLFTGMGLGGVLPNLIALNAEFAGGDSRGRQTTLAFCGLPFGAMLGALAGAVIIPELGWRSIFLLGGVLPLILVVAQLIWLPESPRFRDREAVASPARGRPSLGVIFGPGLAAPTLLVTAALGLGNLVLYFLLTWLPTLLATSGLSLREALLSAVLLNGSGGLGAIALGRLLDRLSPFRTMAATYAIGAAAICFVGLGALHTYLLPPALVLAGATILGGSLGLYVLVARVFPDEIRATGAGFALAGGRVGSICGPILGGLVVGLGWPPAGLMASVALPAVAAGLVIWLLGNQQVGASGAGAGNPARARPPLGEGLGGQPPIS